MRLMRLLYTGGVLALIFSALAGRVQPQIGAFRVLSVSTDGQTNVALDVRIVILFSQNVDPTTVRTISSAAAGAATLTVVAGGAMQNVSAVVVGPSISILPPANGYPAVTQVTVTLTTGIRSLPDVLVGGQPLSANVVSSFRTRDTLRITKVFPAANASAVPTRPTIEVQFSAELIAASVTDQTFALRLGDPNSGPAVSGTRSIAGHRLVFYPSQPLLHLQTYAIVLRGGPSGIRGSNANLELTLFPGSSISRFVTESAAQGGMSPGDGTTPVRADQGGTVLDDAGTGAAATIPRNALKTDTLVKILVLNPAGPFGGTDPGCDVPLAAGDIIPEVPGALRVSGIVRFESSPCGAVAHGPGMTLALPLNVPLPVGSPLTLYQLSRIGNQLLFMETGIQAQVLPAPPVFVLGTMAAAINVQTFGTYAVFVKILTDPPVESELSSRMDGTGTSTPSESFHSPEAAGPVLTADPSATGTKFYFPVAASSAQRSTRLSIANSHVTDDLVVQFTGYDPGGTMHGPAERTIPPRRQQLFEVSSLFPALGSGTIVAEAQSGTMTGSYEIADNFAQPGMLDGAAGIRSGGTTLILPVVNATPGGFTEVYVFNPNDAPLGVRVAAFDASNTPLSLLSVGGTPANVMAIDPYAQFVSASNLSPTQPGEIVIPYEQLSGGYLVFQSIDNRPLLAAGMFLEQLGGESNLAVLNAFALPSGCTANQDCGCNLDDSPASPVPGASKQHTLYATYFDPAAQNDLYLVNVSEDDALAAISAFKPDSSFGGSYPLSGYVSLRAHEVRKLTISAALFPGFDPASWYLRVEDPNSALVGAVVSWDAFGRSFMAASPLVPDDPRQTQLLVDSVFSRVQNDPDTVPGPSRVRTALLILNPNDNLLSFSLEATDGSGVTSSSLAQTMVNRSTYQRDRGSLAGDFPDFQRGFLTVKVSDSLLNGPGRRVLPLIVYRGSKYKCVISEQTK